jgi:hypothetical protein
MSKKYVINLKEGLASEKFSEHAAFIRLYGNQFSYDYFKGNTKAIVCNNAKLNASIKKQNQQRKNLGSGTYGTVDSILFDKEGKVKFSFKRAKYDTYNKPNDQDSSPNVEVRMSRYLSEKFVYPEICPHFVAYIGHNQCKKDMILMMEQCDTTLYAFVKSKTKKDWTYDFDKKDWDCILFQVVITLAILQDHNKYYRHNDLKIDNVFLNILQKPITLYYLWDNKYYTLKTKYIVKIADYGMSSMKNVIDNSSLQTGGYDYVGIDEHQNSHRLYDIFFFLASIKEYCYRNLNYKKRINTSMTNMLMDKVLKYKSNIKLNKDKMHLLEKENKKEQQDYFPENLVPLFKQFLVKEVPNNVRIYSVLSKSQKANKDQNEKIKYPTKLSFNSKVKFVQKEKLMLNEPVIIKNNVVPEKVKKALTKDAKKYFERKKLQQKLKTKEIKEIKETKEINFSKNEKNKLIKLEESGTYNLKCPKGKIPNYKVPGRCTRIDTKTGQEILKLHVEYKGLLKFKMPLKELFKTT